MLLYYNKTIFDNYNAANPDTPLSYPSSDWNNASTFEEIADAARKLTSGTGATKIWFICWTILALLVCILKIVAELAF